ncbi:gluconate:H+ symporter [Parafilimonas terrae]|uniref:Gnt-I system high-affinity gluconate transporter n=1 Tax=Parafilimonas terrae TaxID=1465490 RepID=A0A1I5YUL1_9BACT|nr:gluconate:H+ symporter [Parafilimonas terrae]SFQ47810.1 Gnt-I system high-affinity gluconate transporter [Parafilimonas terrae]
MSFIILLAGIVLLIVLITSAKLNAFLAFLIVSILMGLANGMQVHEIVPAMEKGIGDILGSLSIILCMGAMLGKLIAESGAAQKITTGLVDAFGRKYLMWAMVLTAFIIGIPLFFDVSFVLMVPLIISVSKRYNIPVVYIGLPVVAALSITHGYLPPHPAPTALVKQFGADIGLTMLYGVLIAVPAVIIAGPLFATRLKKYMNKPPDTFVSKDLPENELPSFFNSLFTTFLPVLLIAVATICQQFIQQQNIVTKILIDIGDPPVAMVISVLYALYSLGIRKKKSMTVLMAHLTDSIKDIAVILLILAGAGAMKEILTETGINTQIAGMLDNFHVHPLLAAWTISAVIRIALGSATIAGLTTAGIIAPIIATSGVDPNLMVLATGAGSLIFGHVNDGGFWLFKEYFNLSLKDTFKTWSVMETVVSVVGLGGVFVLNAFMH